jgi:hypothetical protein
MGHHGPEVSMSTTRILSLTLLLACSGDKTGTPTDGDTGTVTQPADTDTDTDTDTDADTDTDTDADTDTDTPYVTPGDTVDTAPPVITPPAFVCPHEVLDNGLTSWSGSLVGLPDFGSGSCGGLGPEYYLSYTAPFEGIFFFDTAGSQVNTVLYATTACENGTELACHDAPGSDRDRIRLDLLEGEEVIVVVDSRGMVGDWQLNLAAYSTIEHDCADGVDNNLDGLVDCFDPQCAGIDEACTIGGACPEFTANTVPITVSGDLALMNDNSTPPCGRFLANGRDARIEFTAPADGVYRFDAQDSLVDATLWLSETCGGAAAECDYYTSPGAKGWIEREMTAGQSVIVHVESESNPGTFNVDIDEVLVSEADCFDNDCQDLPECAEICGNGFDDDGNGATDCRDSLCEDLPECQEQCYNGLDDNFDGRFDCDDAVCDCTCFHDVFVDVIEGNNDYQFDEFRPSSCASSFNAGKDVSFEFVPPTTGSYTFTTDGSNYDTVLYVLTSCGGAEIGCDDDGGISTQSLLTVNLTGGTPYIIVVDGYSSSSDGDFILQVQ